MTVDAIGLLVLRVALGVIYLAHGTRKLGLGNPGGFAGFSGSIKRRGFRPPLLWAVVAVGAEVVGAVLLILGLLTPLAGAMLLGQSLMIVTVAAPRGFWHDKGGVEYPILLSAAALACGLAGAGAISLDAALGIALPPAIGPLAAIAAAAGVVVGLGTRRAPPD
jgi:putative oxidoreductase